MSVLSADGTVGVYDLKTHLSEVLNEVEAGRQVTVTRHGHPIVRLSPVSTPTKEQRRQAIEEIKALRKTLKPLPPGVTIESLYKEGRV